MDATALTFRIDDSVYLRPVNEADVSEVLRAVQENYDHLRIFMEWAKPDYALSDAQEWVTSSVEGAKLSKQLNFVIMRGDKLIGTIGFAHFDHEAKVTEIGYWIDRGEEGKGISSRACGHLLEFAFGELGMNRVQIRCASGNARSAAIPERYGFKKEGVQRQHVKRHGQIYDFWIFGLLKEEWSQRDA